MLTGAPEPSYMKTHLKKLIQNETEKFKWILWTFKNSKENSFKFITLKLIKTKKGKKKIIKGY